MVYRVGLKGAKSACYRLTAQCVLIAVVNEEKEGRKNDDGPIKIERILTFFTSVLVACSAIHVIPQVSMSSTKSVYAVLPPKVVWLFLGPIAEFIRTSIHPGE